MHSHSPSPGKAHLEGVLACLHCWCTCTVTVLYLSATLTVVFVFPYLSATHSHLSATLTVVFVLHIFLQLFLFVSQPRIRMQVSSTFSSIPGSFPSSGAPESPVSAPPSFLVHQRVEAYCVVTSSHNNGCEAAFKKDKQWRYNHSQLVLLLRCVFPVIFFSASAAHQVHTWISSTSAAHCVVLYKYYCRLSRSTRPDGRVQFE